MNKKDKFNENIILDGQTESEGDKDVLMKQLLQENILLRRNRDFFLGIINSTHIPHIIINKKLKILFANHTFYRIFKTTRSQTEKKHFFDLKNGAFDIPDLRNLLKNIFLKRKNIHNYEMSFSFGELGERTFLFNAQPAILKDNECNLMVLAFEDITERKIAEQLQSQLAAVVASSEDAIISKTPDGNIVSWNIGAETIYGYKAEEVVGKHISLLTSAERKKEISVLINKIIKGETVKHFDTIRICKDGTAKNVSISLSPIKDKNGKIVGISTIARDITPRKKAEARLKYLNLLLQTIRNVNQLIVQETDKDKLLIRACELLEKKEAYRDVFIVLKSKNEYKLFSSRNFNERKFTDDLKNGELPYCGQQILHKNKLLIVDKPKKECADCPLIKDDNCNRIIGRLEYKKKVYGFINLKIKQEYLHDEGFISIFKEITGDLSFALYRIELENAADRTKKLLYESEMRFRSFMRYFPGAAFIKDKNHKYLFANKYYEKILGTNQEIIGKKTSDIFPAEIAEKLILKDSEVLKSGKYQKIEEKIIFKNGSEHIFGTHKFPVITETGKMLLGGIAIDITRQKIAADKIKRNLEEKTILLKEVHHRVKNNLQIMSSLLHLQLGNIQDEKSKNSLMNALNRINTMALVHEKLYQSKDFISIDFIEYLHGLIAHIKRIYSFSHKIDFNYSVETPQLNINMAIPCGLITNELISNAVKYAFPKKQNGHISVFFQEKDKHYELVVSDDGIGIPDNIDFNSSETLGLHLVSILTEQIKGNLKLDRSKGSKFIITFAEVELRTFSKL